MIAGEQNVRWFDVAMHNVVDMRASKGIEDLRADAKRLVHRQHPLATQAGSQSLPLEQRRHVEQKPAGFP